MAAYEDAIRHTATPARAVVSSSRPTTSGSPAWWSRAIVDALEKLDLRFPSIDEARRAELAHARSSLMNE